MQTPTAPRAHSLRGKTVFITGGTRGIGHAIALRCAQDGANVVIAAKTVDNDGKLKGTIYEAAEAVNAAGGRGLALQVDVRDEARVAEAVAQAADHFGGIDCLVNNAGAIMLMPVEHLPVKRFDLVFGLNVRAPYLLAQACSPHLRKSSNAHILNLSPPISLEARWFENHTPYTTSKFAMSMMVFGLAAELKAAGIAANALWPRTLIGTAAVEWLGGDALMSGSRTPEIMADAAFEVLTSDARAVTGQFFIDEDLLRARGQTAFDHYQAVPGQPLLTDLFVPEI